MNNVARSARSLILLVAVALFTCVGRAEDIDIFVNATPAATGPRPNVLIVLDNSANWSEASQQWPGGIKQGQAELRSLRRLLNEVNENVNVGLMMFTPGNGVNRDGAYVRFHMRQMTATNKAALQELIGDENCMDRPNSLNGTPNCIYKNFEGSEKVGTAKTDYSAALFEVFKYFGGYTSPANAQSGIPGLPVSASQFGALRYAGDPDPKSDLAAYTDSSRRQYLPAIDAGAACGQNTIIFIGNGFPTQDALPSLLSGVGGATAQLLMPNGSGGYVMPSTNDLRYADEWAKFLYTTDVSAAAGQQGVSVYTIDVFNAQPDVRQTQLMMSMARHGGGRYFVAKNEDAILQSLRDIFIDIQSVSSIFVSTTVPLNATNRAQHENQVYLGMFRPDDDARPRWYGNLKRYQVGLVNGEVTLTDRNNAPLLAASSGYPQACATSWWSTDTGAYWDFSQSSAGLCTSVPISTFSDLPDGPAAEKGAAAEVLRRGNRPQSGDMSFAVNRAMYTCAGVANCSSLIAFDSSTVSQASLGVSSSSEQRRIVDHAKGIDVNDENNNGNMTESRASIHGDVVHSQPLAVNYGGSTGVVLFYGGNDGSFRAVSGETGQELWAFIAPEHHSKLRRLADNSPSIQYPQTGGGITPAPQRKDYFFDGTAGLYQSVDNTTVWIYPAMRRGGRMVYAFDVTKPSAPTLKWRVGCPNLADDVGCTPEYTAIGQTWSTPRVGRILGYNGGTTPIIVMGGGYDPCEDTDVASPSSCAGSGVKGKRIFVISAGTGELLASFSTQRSVSADITLVDRNGDGYVDHAYASDTGGNLYRVDFSDPLSLAPLSSANAWTLTHIAYTRGAGRKFLFAPTIVALKDRAYIAIGSGDRERPLISNYPYIDDVKNRFYVYIDRFVQSPAVDLDGTRMMDFSSDTDCNSTLNTTTSGWYMDLTAGRGEQVVTSALIFGGLIYFSTNRPVPSLPGVCTANLGEARGYAVNLLNASGAIGSQQLCGGARSSIFIGGGLAPSPVAAFLRVNGQPKSIVFGGANRSGAPSSPIGAQHVKPTVSAKRTRVYWYTHGNK